jgi:hypothetical protein
MSFILKLNTEKKNMLLTLEKYDLSDLSTSQSIRTLLDCIEEIKIYYGKKQYINKINDIDEYIDFLFLKYICLYEDDLDHLLDPHRSQLEEVIDFARLIIGQIDKSVIIKYIKVNYVRIFSYDEGYLRSGVRKISLDFIIDFYGGLKESGLFEYLVHEEPIFVFDNYESLSKILKKDSLYLLRELFFYKLNFEKLSVYRFEDICDLTEKLYKDNFVELSENLGNEIFAYISTQLERKEQHIYGIQKMLYKANRTLYLVKSEHSKKMDNMIRKIDEKVNEALLENGKEFSYEVSTNAYNKLMIELEEKGFDTFTKFMTISHWQDIDTGLWYSRLEKSVREYQQSLVDFVSTSRGTNSYFTYGKQMTTDIQITVNSMSLFYWFKDEAKIKDFQSSFKIVIDSIFEVFEYDTKYEGLDGDIDAVIIILSDESRETGKEVFNHMKAMFLISFLEKVLRLVYVCVDEDAFYKKSLITLGTTLGSSQNNYNKLKNIIGEHHLKWTRYYLLTDDSEVGKDYRNRIAHLRGISVGEITYPELFKIAWLVISTINSILVNIVNNIEETDNEEKGNKRP